MATVVSLVSQKGGVGKSTLAIHLATALALRGKRVLLVDGDPQHSALDWQASRKPDPLFPTIGLPTEDLARQVKQLKAGYEWVVIDSPPRVDLIVKSAISAADIVLIPLTPSPYDVWAAQESVKLIQEASVYKENFKAAFVINRKIVNTAIGRDVASILEGYPIGVLTAQVSQRVAFAESAAAGLTVMEIEPASAASREIDALTEEVMSI